MFAIPIGFIVVVLSLVSYAWKLKSRDWRLLDPIHGVMVYLMALALTIIITYSIKAYSAGLRPCYFAMCNYKGYHDALLTGNFTDYFSQTSPDTIGDFSHCLETNPKLLDESRSSFPSGHASLSTVAFAFMALIVTNILTAINARLDVLKAPIIVLFLFPAFIISVQRTKEYYHHYADILAGFVIGLCSAAATHSFAYIYSTIYDPTAEIKAPDDPYLELSQVTPARKSE